MKVQKKINYPKNRAPRINTVLLSKVCITCGKEFTTKLPDRIACSKSCGTFYNHKIRTEEKKKEIQAKREITSLQKYGDRHHINSEHCRKKTEEKLGVKYPWQSKEIQSNIKSRHKEKYGVENPMQRPEIREKMMATKLEKYGDFLKPLYNYKTYTFPSGKTAKVQGYEPRMLDQLLSEGYSEDDIIVGRGKIQQHTGHFKYFSEKTGRMHFYYPDIYVISENRVIEVKSKFTAKMHEDTLLLKQRSVEEKGLRFDLRVF
jgi:DNA-directed RNA polymerase subunit RPC12/RpoP